MKKVLLSASALLFSLVAVQAQTHSDLSGNKPTSNDDGYIYNFNGTKDNNCGGGATEDKLDFFGDANYTWTDGATEGEFVLSETANNPTTWVHTKFTRDDCSSTTLDLSTGVTIKVRAKASSASTGLFVNINGSTSVLVVGAEKSQTLGTEFSTVEYVFATNEYGDVPADAVEGLSFSIAGDAATSVTFDWITLGDTSIVTSSVKEINVSNEVSIAPNPSKGFFNVDLSAFNGKSVAVRLMNSNGAIVLEENAVNELTVNTDGLLKGIYMLQVVSDNKVANKKVVIE